jgi:hypothetical protein
MHKIQVFTLWKLEFLLLRWRSEGLNADKHLLRRLEDKCALLGSYEACSPEERLGGGSLKSCICYVDEFHR